MRFCRALSQSIERPGRAVTRGLAMHVARMFRGDVRKACSRISQRQRDDNKNNICAFEGGGHWRQRGKLSKNAVFFLLFRGKRHDNKILKVQILLLGPKL